MKNPEQRYQEQTIKNASPTELITKLYDFAIQACYQQEAENLKDVLSTLIESLNFDFEISESLFQLYEYCQRKADEGEFEEVRELLEPVREAWIENVVKTSEQAPTIKKGFVV